MKWMEDKPKLAQAYGIWAIARLLYAFALPSIAVQDTSQMGLILVSFILVVITFMFLHRHFMDKIRYRILIRYVGLFVGVGFVGQWLQRLFTDKTILIVLSIVLIVFRAAAEYWLYRSLIFKQYQSLKNGINWFHVVIVSLMAIVGVYFLPNFYIIVECIAWAVIINLIYKERENIKA